MKDKIGGPFLMAAVFCERVLQEKDGVLSPIRIVDQFTHTVAGPDAPDKMPPFTIKVSILIAFKSGDFKGKQDVKITPVAPSGQVLPGISVPILLEGADKGANVNITYVFDAQEEGLYWFNVTLNGKLITRMPLRTIYQKMLTKRSTAEHLH
jgi:hypothetical protein